MLCQLAYIIDIALKSVNVYLILRHNLIIKQHNAMKKVFAFLLLLSFFQVLFAQNIQFDIGTKWYYETELYIGDPSGSHYVNFDVLEIIDTMIFEGQNVFVVQKNEFANAISYMYVEGEKVYFWDDQINDFQLNYDFAETVSYNSEWSGSGQTGTAISHVDSITQEDLNSNLVDVQYLRIENNGSYEGDLLTSIYLNIGQSYGGLRLYLGCGLCDNFSEFTTKLRCFENDGEVYNFVGYPCDSTFFVSNTTSIATNEIEVFPNPSTGEFTIENLTDNTPYKVHDIAGRIVQQGLVQNNRIFIKPKGIYLLKLKVKNHWYVQKVIVAR